MDQRGRRALILDLIAQQGELAVAEVSRRAGVSEMTIRRDLAALERRGALVRLRGRAVAPVSGSYEPPYEVRREQAPFAKEKIGRAAAALIAEGETIVLDTGTTTAEVARALNGRRNITVLTTSMPIAEMLVDAPGIRTLLPGGLIRPGERSLVGDLAVESFGRFCFDTVVLGVGGIDAEAGVTEYNLEDARVKRAAVASARRLIVVADASKLGRVAFARICPIERVDVLVTDDAAPASKLATFEAAGVEVQVSR